MAHFIKRHRLKIFSFFLIFAVGFIFRFWHLSFYPVSLSMDEVAYSYSAYSILKTGKDEHGNTFPLAFKSIGDYKPPVVVYLIAPSLAIFGLNEFGARFPEAFLGSLTVLVFIFLLKELRFSWSASLFGGFWLAISPWHVNFSRAIFAGVTALFFLLTGLLLFLLWTRKKSITFLSLSIISFSLSVWSYHAERVLVPFLFIFLIILFRDKFVNLVRNPQKLIAPFLVLALFTIPFIYITLFTPGVSARAQDLWIFRDQNLSQTLHYGAYSSLQEFIFNNDFYLVFRHWLGQYLNYFDLRVWFWNGLGLTPTNHQDIGFLYLVDLPLFFLGAYGLLVSKNRLVKTLVLFWFFIGPLPGSFTRGEQNPLRALVWLPFFSLVMSCGAEWFISKIKRWKVVFIYLALLIFNIGYFFDLYVHNFHNFYADLWHYGYKEAAQFACENKDKYERIIITDTFGIEGPVIKTVPHLYILFHCQYDPAVYLKKKELYNFIGRRPIWEKDSKLKNSLIIGSPWDFFEEIPEERIIKRIYFPNGKLAFLFIET